MVKTLDYFLNVLYTQVEYNLMNKNIRVNETIYKGGNIVGIFRYCKKKSTVKVFYN